MIQSNVGANNVRRLVRVTRTARAFAPLLLVGAYLGCSADADELDAFESAPEAAVEGGAELAGDAELELGELTQAQTTVCVPQEILGCSGVDVLRCNADGTATTTVPCAPDFECSNGECIPALGTVCLANSVLGCNGPSLVVCNSTQTNTFVVECPAGTACFDRACIVGTVCTANAVIGCSGPSLVVCNDSQTNTFLVDCPTGTTCVDAKCI